jgi:hypothetical protein
MVGSGIRKKPIPDPGSRCKKGPGSGSATLPNSVGDKSTFLKGPLNVFIGSFKSENVAEKIRINRGYFFYFDLSHHTSFSQT